MSVMGLHHLTGLLDQHPDYHHKLMIWSAVLNSSALRNNLTPVQFSRSYGDVALQLSRQHRYIDACLAIFLGAPLPSMDRCETLRVMYDRSRHSLFFLRFVGLVSTVSGVAERHLAENNVSAGAKVLTPSQGLGTIHSLRTFVSNTNIERQLQSYGGGVLLSRHTIASQSCPYCSGEGNSVTNPVPSETIPKEEEGLLLLMIHVLLSQKIASEEEEEKFFNEVIAQQFPGLTLRNIFRPSMLRRVVGVEDDYWSVQSQLWSEIVFSTPHTTTPPLLINTAVIFPSWDSVGTAFRSFTCISSDSQSMMILHSLTSDESFVCENVIGQKVSLSVGGGFVAPHWLCGTTKESAEACASDWIIGDIISSVCVVVVNGKTGVPLFLAYTWSLSLLSNHDLSVFDKIQRTFQRLIQPPDRLSYLYVMKTNSPVTLGMEDDGTITSHYFGHISPDLHHFSPNHRKWFLVTNKYVQWQTLYGVDVWGDCHGRTCLPLPLIAEYANRGCTVKTINYANVIFDQYNKCDLTAQHVLHQFPASQHSLILSSFVRYIRQDVESVSVFENVWNDELFQKEVLSKESGIGETALFPWLLSTLSAFGGGSPPLAWPSHLVRFCLWCMLRCCEYESATKLLSYLASSADLQPVLSTCSPISTKCQQIVPNEEIVWLLENYALKKPSSIASVVADMVGIVVASSSEEDDITPFYNIVLSHPHTPLDLVVRSISLYMQNVYLPLTPRAGELLLLQSEHISFPHIHQLGAANFPRRPDGGHDMAYPFHVIFSNLLHQFPDEEEFGVRASSWWNEEDDFADMPRGDFMRLPSVGILSYSFVSCTPVLTDHITISLSDNLIVVNGNKLALSPLSPYVPQVCPTRQQIQPRYMSFIYPTGRLHPVNTSLESAPLDLHGRLLDELKDWGGMALFGADKKLVELRVLQAGCDITFDGPYLLPKHYWPDNSSTQQRLAWQDVHFDELLRFGARRHLWLPPLRTPEAVLGGLAYEIATKEPLFENEEDVIVGYNKNSNEKEYYHYVYFEVHDKDDDSEIPNAHTRDLVELALQIVHTIHKQYESGNYSHLHIAQLCPPRKCDFPVLAQLGLVNSTPLLLAIRLHQSTIVREMMRHPNAHHIWMTERNNEVMVEAIRLLAVSSSHLRQLPYSSARASTTSLLGLQEITNPKDVKFSVEKGEHTQTHKCFLTWTTTGLKSELVGFPKVIDAVDEQQPPRQARYFAFVQPRDNEDAGAFAYFDDDYNVTTYERWTSTIDTADTKFVLQGPIPTPDLSLFYVEANAWVEGPFILVKDAIRWAYVYSDPDNPDTMPSGAFLVVLSNNATVCYCVEPELRKWDPDKWDDSELPVIPSPARVAVVKALMDVFLEDTQTDKMCLVTDETGAIDLTAFVSLLSYGAVDVLRGNLHHICTSFGKLSVLSLSQLLVLCPANRVLIRVPVDLTDPNGFQTKWAEDAGLSLVHWAALTGDSDFLQEALSVTSDEDTSTVFRLRTKIMYRHPVHYVAYSGSADCAKVLHLHREAMRHSGAIDSRDAGRPQVALPASFEGASALMIAITHGHFACAMNFLEHGASPHVEGKCDWKDNLLDAYRITLVRQRVFGRHILFHPTKSTSAFVQRKRRNYTNALNVMHTNKIIQSRLMRIAFRDFFFDVFVFGALVVVIVLLYTYMYSASMLEGDRFYHVSILQDMFTSSTMTYGIQGPEWSPTTLADYFTVTLLPTSLQPSLRGHTLMSSLLFGLYAADRNSFSMLDAIVRNVISTANNTTTELDCTPRWNVTSQTSSSSIITYQSPYTMGWSDFQHFFLMVPNTNTSCDLDADVEVVKTKFVGMFTALQNFNRTWGVTTSTSLFSEELQIMYVITVTLSRLSGGSLLYDSNTHEIRLKSDSDVAVVYVLVTIILGYVVGALGKVIMLVLHGDSERPADASVTVLRLVAAEDNGSGVSNYSKFAHFIRAIFTTTVRRPYKWVLHNQDTFMYAIIPTLVGCALLLIVSVQTIYIQYNYLSGLTTTGLNNGYDVMVTATQLDSLRVNIAFLGTFVILALLHSAVLVPEVGSSLATIRIVFTPKVLFMLCFFICLAVCMGYFYHVIAGGSVEGARTFHTAFLVALNDIVSGGSVLFDQEHTREKIDPSLRSVFLVFFLIMIVFVLQTFVFVIVWIKYEEAGQSGDAWWYQLISDRYVTTNVLPSNPSKLGLTPTSDRTVTDEMLLMEARSLRASLRDGS